MLDWLPNPLHKLDYPNQLGLPDHTAEAKCEDGGRLLAFVWGQGQPRAPYYLQLWYEPPPLEEGADPLPVRAPTLEELTDAIHQHTPRGALMTLPPMLSLGADFEPPEPRGSVGVSAIQGGAASGTVAGRRWKLGGGEPGGMPGIER